ncbi:hypothetical protein PNOK_0847200 [Pyrrhoderma noxium]|uniref:Uncharacterized protein n=1 Tax=Pyrrhoderma noxium TaxID=2282107 RepID=A0A286U7X6_9AGAM|nr:hypothetical protein PNOK_0847200 [Pyrrhoderma noxium]
MLALGARISRALSRDGNTADTISQTSLEGSTVAPSVVTLSGSSVNGSYHDKSFGMSELDKRSQSRGREPFSTGRGGAGNMRQQVPNAVTEGSPAPRGRETVPAIHNEAPTSVGRGGAGNFRSPSKEPERGNYERNDEHTFSTGRGGLGNIHSTPEHSRSRSRGPEDSVATPERSQSRTRGRIMHSTGRGGAGNITRLPEESVLEDERAFSPPRDGQIHSTGRGGLANITALNEPHVESPPGTEGSGTGTQFFSTGRGGAGNIGRSSSRGPGRSSSRGPENKHGQSAIGR